MRNIRNFSIIAHVNHGKSTLADRMLEVTETLPDRDMKDQVLDQMDLEQERGITIKMTPVTMRWTPTHRKSANNPPSPSSSGTTEGRGKTPASAQSDSAEDSDETRSSSPRNAAESEPRQRREVAGGEARQTSKENDLDAGAASLRNSASGPHSSAQVEDEYVLNLIDTPGHVDFSYEVSRALSAVEGAILLVDSTQGIEAQTLSVLSIARDLDLTIIPAVTKIDSGTARPQEVAREVAGLLDADPESVARVSGKEGTGVERLLDRVVSAVPPPAGQPGKETKGLVFDFDYTTHRGVVAYTRVFSGRLKEDSELELLAADQDFQPAEVGIFSPDPQPADSLTAGSVGYVVTGIKEPGVVTIGDTIAGAGESVSALPGYEPPQPVVWASVYPENQDDFNQLKNALSQLILSDSSLQYERTKSTGLGQGFRCGFLGRLHMEITVERLRRDYGLELITTRPTVSFRVTTDKGETKTVRTPTRFPHYGDIEAIAEPYVEATIRTPGEYMNNIMTLVYDHEGEVTSTTSGDLDQLTVTVQLPLRELMRGFFSRLKRASSGFASLSYELIEYRPAEVVKLEVLVGGDKIPALAEIVSAKRQQKRAREVVEKLKELLPQQIVSVRIQAQVKGDVIAAETLPATRKDVTEGLYGGDYSRKKKQLKNQREGKKQMKEDMNVQIPSDVYIEMLQQ